MKCCIDCNKPLNNSYTKRCIDCRVIQRRKVAKANKDKYQYHKRPKPLYARYKRGAESRSFVFDLTLEEFTSLWNKPCHYCNDLIDTIGLDRLNNTIGYTVSNVVPCCKSCNFMKHTMNYQAFIDKCIKISKVFC
jgi:hypothetical protein